MKGQRATERKQKRHETNHMNGGQEKCRNRTRRKSKKWRRRKKWSDSEWGEVA